MKHISKKKSTKPLTAEEFDAAFDRGEDMTPYLDLDNAVLIRPVHIQFPQWMTDRLEVEARRLHVSLDAIVKLWIGDRLAHSSLS